MGRKLISALTVCALFLPLHSQAKICGAVKGDPESPGKYIIAVANALSQLKEGSDTILAETKKNNRNPNRATDFMVAQKTADEDYECAISYISHFKDSKDSTISLTADNIENSIIVIRQYMADLVDEMKISLNGDVSKIGAGTMAEKNAEGIIKSRKAWETILLAVMGATHAAMGEPDPKNSKSHKVMITKGERDEALRVLGMSFKLPLKQNENGALETAASNLHSFLSQKWKFKP